MEYTLDQDVNGVMAIKTKSIVDQGNQDIVNENYKDVQGRVISTMNESPNGPIWTIFEYNAISELLSYTDAEGIITSYEYDKFGRKTSVNHPDNGITTFEYDLASNLTALSTANLASQGQQITYEYDIKRLVAINYPDNPNGSPNISNVVYEYGSSGNETGRLIYQSDASGAQEFQYGNMGEMIYNRRTVVGPTPTMPIRSFVTEFSYDSWNRLQNMTYPDGEKVNFEYDLGGNLSKMIGEVNGNSYDYIQRIDYDYYEQRTYLLYGNGTETFYDYTPELRRLNNLNVKTSNGQDLFINDYAYDNVGNVTNISNSAGSTINYMGGNYSHNFTYDKLNRLSYAEGIFDGDMQQASLGNDYYSDYQLTMKYNDTHGITQKIQNHFKNSNTHALNTYENNYEYLQDTHKVSMITDGYTGEEEYFSYDENGNLINKANSQGDNRDLLWDESNRLRVLSDNFNSLQHYIYDAAGERILKANSDVEAVYQNGTLLDAPSVTMNNYITYPSAFLVIDENGIYSKHYYAGTQRIVSKLGDEGSSFFDQKSSSPKKSESNQKESKEVDYKKLQATQLADLQQYLDKAKMGKVKFKEYKTYTYEEIEEALSEYDEEQSIEAKKVPPTPVYFYHPDHLGTSTFLTDFNGNAYQFFLNLPFGETMAEQKGTEFYQSPYKFNGKELDEETGLYYYGARYYDPKVSIWLSVDPLAEIAPNKTPYHFVSNNPINRVDPRGLTDYKVNGEVRTINDGHDDVTMNVSERQFNRLQRKFDKGGSGYERMMNRMSVQNGFTTFSSIADGSGNRLNTIEMTTHKAGGDSYGQWSIQNNHQTYGVVEHIARVADAGFGSVTGQFGNINLGSNGSMYFRQNSGAIFRGNQYVNVTSAASKYSGWVKGAKWGGYATGVVLGGYEIYQGYQQDGGTYGYNAKVQTAGAVGGFVGGLGGAKGGAALGAAVGVWFGGVGAVPGAIIGGLIGGGLGAWGGDYYGEKAAKTLMD